MVVSEKVIKRLMHMGINEATLYAVQLARDAEEPRKVLDELWSARVGRSTTLLHWMVPTT